jgi:glutathione synthase/RimK-type ligase-like ATP-grasp enzyme
MDLKVGVDIIRSSKVLYWLKVNSSPGLEGIRRLRTKIWGEMIKAIEKNFIKAK